MKWLVVVEKRPKDRSVRPKAKVFPSKETAMIQVRKIKLQYSGKFHNIVERNPLSSNGKAEYWIHPFGDRKIRLIGSKGIEIKLFPVKNPDEVIDDYYIRA